MSRARRAAWLAGFALVFFLSFPHPIGGRVLDLGLFASWLAPALLLLGLRGLAPRPAAGAAFAAGLAAHAALYHWIYVATVSYGHAPTPVGVGAAIALALYPAAFFAAFGAGASALRRTRLASPFALAALWLALEHARTVFATGFPWGLLGYAQHDNTALLAWAPLAGVWAPGFAVALGSAALAALWEARTSGRGARGALLAIASVAAAIGAGALDLARDGAQPAETVRVAVLQGNVDQDVKWSPEWAERTLAGYEALSRRAGEAGAAVIVWPETAVPGSPDHDAVLADRLAALARETNAALVVGAVGVEPVREGGVRYYDSAFVVSPDGVFADRYDKTHLVPFGEYVPFRDFLGRFVSAIARGAATTDVSPGAVPRALAIPLPDGSALTAGVPICYELLFPDGVRRFTKDGAELLLAITNDAWYGRTGAPYQFLVMTAMRSAENRVWTARAANTGVSAMIDDRGRVRMQTDLFVQDLLVADIPRRPAPVGGSFYARHGDWLPGACWIALGGLAIAARWRRGARA
ncbi:MAG: apolipoprotein N-acyltransferase [Proteobacteria bacterium]|nr:MAG: apolipoprotein N-acyltransferase [Pseudomonadota bacterium]